jgi:hypothetical protein
MKYSTNNKSWRKFVNDKTFVAIWKKSKAFNSSSPFLNTFAGFAVSCWELLFVSI